MQLQAKGFPSTVKSNQAIRTCYVKRSIMNLLFPHPPRNLLGAADNIRSASGSPIRSLRFLRGLHPPRTEVWSLQLFQKRKRGISFQFTPLSLSQFSSTCLKKFQCCHPWQMHLSTALLIGEHLAAGKGTTEWVSSSQSLISVGPCLQPAPLRVARGKGKGIEV